MYSDQERFEREQQFRRQRFGGFEPSGSHGGWLETFAKTAFIAAAVVLAAGSLQRAAIMADRAPRVTEFERVMFVTRAEAIEREYNATGVRWTNVQVVDARGELIRARDRLDRESHEGRRVQRVIDRVVRDALERRYRRAEASRGDEQQRAIAARWELQQMFDIQGMDGWGAVEQQVDAMGNTMWMPKAKPEERSRVVGVLKFCGLLYLLFMPFVLLAFLARMKKSGMSVWEELYFGWQNLLGSVVFWPAALGSFPRSTARELRRAVLMAEYMVRVGTRERGELTARDLIEIEALVEVPFAELRQRLTEIQLIPAEALLRARLAVYATMIAAFLMGPFANIARAQARSGGAVEKAVAAEVTGPQRLELHGFLHGEGGGPGVPFGIRRLWLIGDARPHEAVQLRVIPNLVGPEGKPMLVGGFAIVKIARTPFGFRAGQFAQRGADAVPRPDMERLIGGPGARALVTFFEPAAEMFGKHGRLGWSLGAASGSGQNVPDANAHKDVLGSVAWGPWGTLRFQLVFQAGEQPDGFRMRSLANAACQFGPVTVDALATHERFGDTDSLAVSMFVGWRVHGLVDLAAGYDELRIHKQDPMAPPYAPDHVARGQATLHLFDGVVQIGAQHRWSRSAGHQGLARLQVSF